MAVFRFSKDLGLLLCHFRSVGTIGTLPIKSDPHPYCGVQFKDLHYILVFLNFFMTETPKDLML